MEIIDFKQVADDLTKLKCDAHGSGVDVYVYSHSVLFPATCCDEFKKRLEGEFERLVEDQVQLAFERMWKA